MLAALARGRKVPGPATPFASEGASWQPDSPMDYGDPGGGHNYAPDNRVGPDGTPDDFLGPIGDNAALPPAWRRADTSGRQVAGVGINLRDNNTAAVDGWGRLRPPSEFLQDEGGLVTMFPDARYAGDVDQSAITNYDYQAWANPVQSSTAAQPPMTGFVPYVTEL